MRGYLYGRVRTVPISNRGFSTKVGTGGHRPKARFSYAIFKAYDIRGIYPEEINEKIVAIIARVLSRHFSLNSKSYILNPVIVVSHDARLSSPSLYKAVLKNLRHSNVLKNIRMKIIEAGMITTPMLYFLVNRLKAVGGIMVTASHNPKEYNGLKVVGPKAIPVSGKEILTLVKSS